MARAPKPRRTWPQRIILGFHAAVIVAALLAATALSYVKETVNDTSRTVAVGPELAAEVAEGEPVNFLLVGADSIATLPDDHPLRNTRGENLLLTDTLIVLRLDPEAGTVSAISVPRDLYVPIDGFGSESRVNSALALGGTGTLVATVQDYLDIPIHYYIQVDFNGFLELVSLIDGITVWMEYPVKDEKAQLEISQTGCVTLTPEQSLGFVRSRTMLAQVDGQWVRVDGRSDLGRIDRQQDFLVAVLRQAISQGVRNPRTLGPLVDDAQKAVTLGTRLTPADMLRFGEQFRNLRPEDLQKYTLPVYDDEVGDAEEGTLQLILRMKEEEAQPVLNVFRGAASDAFRVTVFNGNGVTNQAGTAAGQLTAEGLEVAAAVDADRFDYQRTQVRYSASQRESAELLSRWLVNGAELLEVAESDGTVQLIVGADWAGVLESPSTISNSTEAPTEAPTQAPTSEPAIDPSPDPTATPVPTALPTEPSEPTPEPVPVATPEPDTGPAPGELRPIVVSDPRCS